MYPQQIIEVNYSDVIANLSEQMIDNIFASSIFLFIYVLLNMYSFRPYSKRLKIDNAELKDKITQIADAIALVAALVLIAVVYVNKSGLNS